MKNFIFETVPPPETMLKKSNNYGILECLTVEEDSGKQYRCASCDQMQPANSPMVWVPDVLYKNDPIWAFEEQARLPFYNGTSSGWCIKCAPKQPKAIAQQTEPKSLVQRLITLLFG